MKRVSGKVAVVTGAGAGIGEATANKFAREGASVVVTDINVEQGKRVVDEIASVGGKAHFFEQDVVDPESWARVFDEALETYGPCSILVNNAGFAPAQDIETVSLEEWRSVTAVNLDSVHLGTQAAINHMKEHGGGAIVNISSIVGLVGEPATPAYGAAKGGIRQYTKSAALYCARKGYGIRVNSVHPGCIHTPLLERAAALTGNPEAFLSQAVMAHPIGRIGKPEEVAAGVLFLASDEASFITGTELVIDGGYTAQ